MTQMTREQQVAALEKEWATNPRWKGIQRGYTAADVVRLRGSLQVDHTLAKRGAEKLWTLVNTEPFVNTLGALTGMQAHAAGQGGAEGNLPVGLAGRRPMPTAPGEMYPDQSLYPVDSVPKVDQAASTARCARADQIATMERVDGKADDRTHYMAPIVADAEAGFGGALNAYRADEGDDRGRCGRRALRGPAGLRQEVRPHGRQGAGAHA